MAILMNSNPKLTFCFENSTQREEFLRVLSDISNNMTSSGCEQTVGNGLFIKNILETVIFSDIRERKGWNPDDAIRHELKKNRSNNWTGS